MDLHATPIIAVLPADADAAAKSAREQFSEALKATEQAESVITARSEFEMLSAKLAGLNSGRDKLNARGRTLIERVCAGESRIDAAILSQFADDGPEADPALIDSLVRDTAESRSVTRVLEGIVTRLIPEVTVAMLRSESRLLGVRSRELTRLAEERFEKTAAMLRSAQDFEAGLQIDTRGTITGTILQYAKELAVEAAQLATRADEAERNHRKLTADIEAAAEAKKGNT